MSTTAPPSRYDKDAVKAALSLIEVMEGDGYVIRRVGSSFMTHSPWNRDERTPSCSVDDDRGLYCHASGNGGDIFTYWMQEHDVDFPTALQQLGELSSVTPDTWQPNAPRPVRKAPAVREQQPATALSPAALQDWIGQCQALAQDSDACQRLATWRGYHPATITWAAREGYLALSPFQGAPRETFLVERPGAEHDLGQRTVPVALHHRLAPRSPGNPSDKASWRFHPTGVGSWPITIGDPTQADYVWIVEGQWDALALIDLMGWAPDFPIHHTAVIGLRGATSWRRALAYQMPKPSAFCVVIADADPAGDRWFQDEDGLVTTLRHFLSRGHVHFLQPKERGQDLNDCLQSGQLTKDDIIAALRRPLAQWKGKPRKATFAQWCSHLSSTHARAKADAHPHLAAARWVACDEHAPRGKAGIQVWLRHWQFQHRLQLPGFPGIAALQDCRHAYRQHLHSLKQQRH